MFTKSTIVLVGMPGSGKTSLGAQLALQCNLPFSDSDVVFQKIFGCSPALFLSLFTEYDFRYREFLVLSSLIEIPQVIATGGGCVSFPPTIHLLKNHTFTIWINPSLKHNIKNLCSSEEQKKRPLLPLHNLSLATTLRKLRYQRSPLYRQSSHLIFKPRSSNITKESDRLYKFLI